MPSEKARNSPGLSPVEGQKPSLAPRQGLWVSPRPRHHAQCWFTNQRLIILRMSRLGTPRAGFIGGSDTVLLCARTQFSD
jgi:hypothetical protein